MIKYISPSSLGLFYSDREKFYKRYLAYPGEPREPTSKPMLLGSAFDAFVKHALTEDIHGAEAVQDGQAFHLQTLFNGQVEDCEHTQWAWETGKKLFEVYKDTGALDALLSDIEGAQVPPVFEHEVTAPLGGIPIRGFIDCYYVNRDGQGVILDWKCNNHCGKRKMSPKKYYIMRRPSGVSHPKAMPVNGLMSEELCFSNIDSKWADQLAIYSWMVGHPGAIVQIEQLLGQPDTIEVVTYRGRISEEYKLGLLERIHHMWQVVQSGHTFDDLALEESNARCLKLQRKCNFLHSNPAMAKILKDSHGK